MIILYPTETLYALGVNALDEAAVEQLFALKGRDMLQHSSWLVRDVEDLKKYAHVPSKAEKIIEKFLPGSLTLILNANDKVPDFRRGTENEISFRISSDPLTQKIIEAFMEENDAPLTCTSANVHGAPTFSTPGEILQQFGEKAQRIEKIYDDGPRKALASTIVRIIDDTVTILREGDISEEEIRRVSGEVVSAQQDKR